MIRIIGIDPGTGILGFGVIDFQNGKSRLVDAGVITTPHHTPQEDRLLEIYEGLTGIIKDTRPERMAVEKLYFNQNITTGIGVAEARGVAVLTGRQANLKIDHYTPLEVKSTIASYGRANKKQVQEMVRLHLGLAEVPKPDDCADALAIAIMCGILNQH